MINGNMRGSEGQSECNVPDPPQRRVCDANREDSCVCWRPVLAVAGAADWVFRVGVLHGRTFTWYHQRQRDSAPFTHTENVFPSSSGVFLGC